MGKEYAVNGAICQCMFGTMPGILKVIDNLNVCMNGKPTATDKTLGNSFEPPGFCLCKKSWPPKPCTPVITSWVGAYEGVSINGSSAPLLETSKGTCALGCTNCIAFQTSGQIPIPNDKQVNEAAMALRNDINPLAVDEPGIVTYHIYWDGRIEKHVPKVIKNGYENNYMYIYHDENEQKHEIGFANIKPTKIYGAKSGIVNLIDLRSVPKEYRNGNKHYRLSMNTPRTYTNEQTWASLLGAMLEVCFDDIVCNGFSMSDGSPGDSASHLNGKNGDIRYLRKDKSGKKLDLSLTPDELDVIRQVAWNEALYKFGWKSFLGWPYKHEGKARNLPHTKKWPNHHHHLHLQGYLPNLKVINK